MMLFNNPTGAAEAGVTRRGESPPTSITRAGETTEARRRVVGDDVMMTSQRIFDVLMMNFFCEGLFQLVFNIIVLKILISTIPFYSQLSKKV